jgi:transcriptional regulator with XRE-family HTH domain
MRTPTSQLSYPLVSERERKIGARLRSFRELLQIPRTRFAVAIGFGGERMAAYEAGRARIPYVVFKAVATRYNLYPRWLAEGEGSPQVPNSFDDRAFAPGLKRHAIFSEVYDKHLAPQMTAGAEGSAATMDLLSRTAMLLQQVDIYSLTPVQRKKLNRFNTLQARLIRKIKAELDLRDSMDVRALELIKKPGEY